MTMVKFLLFANSQGKVRVSSHYWHLKSSERLILENDVIKKCLARKDDQCFTFDYRDLKLVYRRYGNLLIVAGIDDSENELAVYEFIHLLMETLDAYFNKVTEMHIVFNLDKVHMIIQEMVVNGLLVGTSIKRTLSTIHVLDKLSIK